MPETEWFVQRGDERYPVTGVEMLREWARTGNLRPTDQVWNPVAGQWAVARDMSELSDVLAQPAAATATPMPQPTTPAAVNAIGIRFAAVLIDVIPAIIIGLVGIIPIIGQLIAGIVLGCYWLLRDINGASLGKMALGLVVVMADGTPSDQSA